MDKKKINENVDFLAESLAHKRMEKKYKHSPVRWRVPHYDEYISFNYTPKAKKEFDKFVIYYKNILNEH